MRNSLLFRQCRWLGAALFAVLSTSLLWTSDAPAQSKEKAKKPRIVVFMKDGFPVEGFLKQEKVEIEVDDYQGVPVSFPKGFYLLDDGPRRVAFASFHVGHIDPIKGYDEEALTHKPTKADFRPGIIIPSIMEIVETSEFDRNWERTLKFRGQDRTQKNKVGTYTVTQHVGRLTPTSLRIDTTKDFNFASAYLTREFSADVIKSLLASHPDYADNPGATPEVRLNRHYAFAEFMAQAGFFKEAEDELELALKEMPKKKDEIKKRQDAVGEIKARESWEETKRMAVLGGQFQRVIKRIDNFPMEYATEEMRTKMRELKSDYESAERRRQQAVKSLRELGDAVKDANAETFHEAAQQISLELCVDNVGRLETFLGQAEQYERKKSELGPTELMSLAVSSWLLGNTAGETKPETALRLWKLRQLIIKYEKIDDLNLRQKTAAAAARDSDEAAMVEEAAQLIPNLPPSEPGEIDTNIQEVKTAKNNTAYSLQLPPEYRHGRPYPVLIVLHQSGEKPQAMLKRWRDAARDNGYILVAPEWEKNGGGYEYSEREHLTVLDTIRDLRRKYRVDSDRVFLFGLREGGVMALDVGLSHPDLFAGVSTMGAAPEKYSEAYWHNAQYLPIYMVNGDRTGTLAEKTHAQFKNWIEHHFPALWVQYKGRGAEWFGGEVPMIFEWMRVKQRAFPLTQLGREGSGGAGTEFNTERPTDNSFYWLTTDEVSKVHWNGTGANFRINATPAQLAGMTYVDNNDVRVKAVGINQVTVWVGRNQRGESNVDLSKPVSFRVNNEQVLNKKMVTPSLAVLLEDQYQRGDRQRVYLAKLDWPRRR